MYYQLLFINNIYFLLIKDILLNMTINNPIFIFTLITVIWFIPGILVRRINELKQIKKSKRDKLMLLISYIPIPKIHLINKKYRI